MLVSGRVGTPLKFNSLPLKNWWLEDYYPFGMVTFHGFWEDTPWKLTWKSQKWSFPKGISFSRDWFFRFHVIKLQGSIFTKIRTNAIATDSKYCQIRHTVGIGTHTFATAKWRLRKPFLHVTIAILNHIQTICGKKRCTQIFKNILRTPATSFSFSFCFFNNRGECCIFTFSRLPFQIPFGLHESTGTSICFKRTSAGFSWSAEMAQFLLVLYRPFTNLPSLLLCHLFW